MGARDLEKHISTIAEMIRSRLGRLEFPMAAQCNTHFDNTLT
jgi:hypothetical protein